MRMESFFRDGHMSLGTGEGDSTGLSRGGSGGGGWGEKTEPIAFRFPMECDLVKGMEGDFKILGDRQGR